MNYFKKIRCQALLCAGPVMGLIATSGCATDEADDGAGGTAGAGTGANAGSGASGGSSAAGAGGSALGGSSGSGATNAGTSGSAGGPPEQVYGSIKVELERAAGGDDGYTTLIARFADGPTPPTIPLELDSESGDCQLLVPSRPFCEACASGVCTADDVCTDYPTAVAMGTLTVDGLGETLVIEPVTAMHVYQSSALPNPPCVPGEPVQASSSEFELSAACISELELTGPDPIPVESGEVVPVAWEPSETAGSRIQIALDIAHHGGKTGEIRCDVPDTGSFDIPEPLVTKLVGLGLAGYPTIEVSRVSIGTDPTGRELNLVISSKTVRDVDTGVTSCQGDEDCPEGQTCQASLVCG